MTDLDRLYRLLPPIYRDRDADQNFAARDLLRVICGPVLAVEADVAQTYENWFIETCTDSLVPYLGDLVGYQPVNEPGEAGAAGALGRALTPRREVANMIRLRRRKGTLAVLEELARAVAGWPSRAVEYGGALPTLDVRDPAALDLLGTPFDAQARFVDVRRPGSVVSPGHPNLPDVLLYVWRLRAFRVSRTRAYRLHGKTGCFRFSVLGNDAPIFTRPVEEEDPNHLAQEINVPGPIRRRALRERVDGPDGEAHWAVPESYYGEEKSFALYAKDWPHKGAAQPVPRELILSKDLCHWVEPPVGYVFVDPVLGRLRFPCAGFVPHQPQLTYHYGSAMALGGGEYPRDLQEPVGAIFYRVKKGGSIADALADWMRGGVQHAVIEIENSGYYKAPFDVQLTAGQSLQIRAGRNARPVVEIDTQSNDTPDAAVFQGVPGNRLTLDGLLLFGAAVRVSGSAPDGTGHAGNECPFEINICHCTFLPGLSFDHECHDADDGACDCEVNDCEATSLELLDIDGCVTIESSIVGTIQIEQNEVTTDPLRLTIRDSIIDSAPHSRGSDASSLGANHAIFSRHCGLYAHATLRLARCTFFGLVKVHAIAAADDCLFADGVHVARRQLGCLRFCYVAGDSRTPRRYQCQPDRALRALTAPDGTPPPLADQSRERVRVAPRFMTRRYGKPDYARLSLDCPAEIARGAEDKSEMGVYHDLYDPQRADNLRARLDEFVPADAEAGVMIET